MSDIFKINSKVSYADRCCIIKQKGIVLWFTGLSGSGKSTIAIELEKKLADKNKLSFLLDGDNIRAGVNKDLGFSDNDRIENIRRLIEIAILFKNAGIITLVSFITPFREMRRNAKEKIGNEYFFEIYVKASFEECKKRDVKGLYKKAVTNEIKDFTGITSLYEIPENPDLILDTEDESIEESVEKVFNFAFQKIMI
jgi:adenylyl-sulfate kinase